jgi:hypothetical protein
MRGILLGFPADRIVPDFSDLLKCQLIYTMGTCAHFDNRVLRVYKPVPN